MTPSKSILHREFRYMSSANTDIRKLFDRVRRELKAEAEKQPSNVKPLKKVAKS